MANYIFSDSKFTTDAEAFLRSITTKGMVVKEGDIILGDEPVGSTIYPSPRLRCCGVPSAGWSGTLICGHDNGTIVTGSFQGVASIQAHNETLTGTTNLNIQGGNNLGVGDNNPQCKLHVRGNGTAFADYGIGTFETSLREGLTIGYDTVNNRVFLYSRVVGSGGRGISINDNVEIPDPTSSTKLRINTGGLLLGLSNNPIEKLDYFVQSLTFGGPIPDTAVNISLQLVGNMCTLYIPKFSNTGNSTLAQLVSTTALPAKYRPETGLDASACVYTDDNGTKQVGQVTIGDSGIISFSFDVNTINFPSTAGPLGVSAVSVSYRVTA